MDNVLHNALITTLIFDKANVCGGDMSDEKTICVVCAWRQTCNKKFSMDGATTTRCTDYTRDITLRQPESEEQDMESREREGRD